MGRQLPRSAGPSALSVFVRPADRLCPLKVGDELFLDSIDAEVDEKLQFRFDIAFVEPGVLECESVLETLQQMADLLEGLIRSFATFV